MFAYGPFMSYSCYIVIGKQVLLLSTPMAFSPGCSNKHIPGYMQVGYMANITCAALPVMHAYCFHLCTALKPIHIMKTKHIHKAKLCTSTPLPILRLADLGCCTTLCLSIQGDTLSLKWLTIMPYNPL